jgi:hypothetical protein
MIIDYFQSVQLGDEIPLPPSLATTGGRVCGGSGKGSLEPPPLTHGPPTDDDEYVRLLSGGVLN